MSPCRSRPTRLAMSAAENGRDNHVTRHCRSDASRKVSSEVVRQVAQHLLREPRFGSNSAKSGRFRPRNLTILWSNSVNSDRGHEQCRRGCGEGGGLLRLRHLAFPGHRVLEVNPAKCCVVPRGGSTATHTTWTLALLISPVVRGRRSGGPLATVHVDLRLLSLFLHWCTASSRKALGCGGLPLPTHQTGAMKARARAREPLSDVQHGFCSLGTKRQLGSLP